MPLRSIFYVRQELISGVEGKLLG